MTWLLTNLADVLLFLAGVLALCSGGYFAFWNLAVGLWKLPYLFRLRPRLAGWVLFLCILLMTLIVRALLPSANAIAITFAVAAIAPGPAIRLTSYLAWRRGKGEREPAAEVRNEIARRLNEREVDPNRSWPTFVFDVERARRHAEFDPPPI